MTRYPINEKMIQLDMAHCPAPFCGRPMGLPDRVWFTLVMDYGAWLKSLVDETISNKATKLMTCSRPECRVWAELRADDIPLGRYGAGCCSASAWRTSAYERGETL